MVPEFTKRNITIFAFITAVVMFVSMIVAFVFMINGDSDNATAFAIMAATFAFLTVIAGGQAARKR